MKNDFSTTPQFLSKLNDIERFIESNALENAVAALNQLAKSAPRDPRLFLLGSRLAHASGNPEGVLQAAAKASQYAPQWPVATLHFASVLAQRGEIEPAMAFAAKAVEQASKQGTLNLELLHTVAGLAHSLNLPGQALVWLEHTFNQFRRDGGAVYFHKRTFSTVAFFVHPAGNQFLSCATFAGNQNAGICGCYPFNHIFDFGDSRRFTNHFVLLADFPF